MLAPKVLIPLATGCEELEAVTVIDLLRRAEIEVVTASLTSDLTLIASRGVTILADTTLDAVMADDFDMIILPGGQPGTYNLNADPRIHQFLIKMSAEDKWLAAICAAPLVLATAGLLNGFQATAYPGVLKAEDWPEIKLCDDAVVIDKRRLTSRSPGTAMGFALNIIEQLTDKIRSDQVAKALARS